ncbi:tubby-like F-box protein 7 isoform X2 [Impatiens glandulifera]|uniref:tubby-like F-box protein 7 isoform X2 n=1 Tax=Impatiens glandulifera TaxID=253017 RepID=UPI001FB0BCA6|nr:tubby-like F-box protein 7 isoform X2 [Impatiens glandulifera]
MSLGKSRLSSSSSPPMIANPLSKSFKDILVGSPSNHERSRRDHDDGDGIVDVSIDVPDSDNRSWSMLFPELLYDIIKRLDDDHWPNRKNVVSCACVCKNWRKVTKEVVKSALNSGTLTFPSCLKQPGPPDLPIQCVVTRDKKNSTYYLYLSLPPSITEKGKFLLAARRCRQGAHTEYIISLSADEISQGSNTYVGKISSDIIGTNFRIYDSQPSSDRRRTNRWFSSKQISPQIVPSANIEIGHVAYNFSILHYRSPRRMRCMVKGADQNTTKKRDGSYDTVLENKAPRWHGHLQCWCLNFHGRVTVASVKNFQLAETVDQSQPEGEGDGETVLLQFGKLCEC